MVELKTVCVGVVALVFVVSCTSGYRIPPVGEEKVETAHEKIEVEAYLFDARLRRRGKPTSFRLEIFQTDSVLALGGRAYLGKGALKGRLTADSLEVYFPSSNEYLYESLSDLFVTTECPNKLARLNLLRLFDSLPDSVEEMGSVRVMADYSNSKRPQFNIFLQDCPWEMELTYDWQGTGWRIRHFKFDNGKEISLKAQRREYKKKAFVRAGKFVLAIPVDVLRITP